MYLHPTFFDEICFEPMFSMVQTKFCWPTVVNLACLQETYPLLQKSLDNVYLRTWMLFSPLHLTAVSVHTHIHT